MRLLLQGVLFLVMLLFGGCDVGYEEGEAPAGVVGPIVIDMNVSFPVIDRDKGGVEKERYKSAQLQIFYAELLTWRHRIPQFVDESIKSSGSSYPGSADSGKFEF